MLPRKSLPFRTFVNVAVISAILACVVTFPAQPVSARVAAPPNGQPAPGLPFLKVPAARQADQKQKPGFAAGRFLVRFADTLAEPADVIHDQGLSFAAESAAKGAELDQLHQKHRIKAVKPLFRELFASGSDSPRTGALAQRKRRFSDHIRKVKMKYQVRTLRASKQSAVPDLTSLYVFETPVDADIAAICREYAANPNVLYAVPASPYSVQSVPNDPYFASSGSWGYPYDDLWGLKKIGMESAWNSAKGEGVLVAVVDTGLDYNHPDISANVWSNPAEANGSPGMDDDNNGFIDDATGWDFHNEDNDPMDGDGHGTHVSGTIAAVGDNGIGVVGVAYRARIMPLKGLGDDGWGYTDRLASAIVYAANNGAQVISNSWGGGGYDPVLADAVATAHALGSVVVAAAGNDSSDVRSFTPANLPEVVTVGSTGVDDSLSFFSNWGYLIDVVAPGGGGPNSGTDGTYNILSLLASGTDWPGYTVADRYLRLAGTSMATPHVSGVAALLLSANPQLSREQVAAILRRSSDDQVGPAELDQPGFDLFYGWGRLNAARAVALAFAPPADPPLLKVPPTRLDYLLPATLCGEPRALSVEIFNLGGGTLDWSAEAPPWLTVTPASGQAYAAPRVSVAEAQERQGVLSLLAPEAADGRQDLPVSVTVAPEVRVDNCDLGLTRAPGNQGWGPIWNVNVPGIADGQGGAIYVWQDARTNPNLTIQRIDSNGRPMWQANGKPLAVTPYYPLNDGESGAAGQPALASDGSGGAIVAYREGLDSVDDSDKHLRVQRVDASGNLLWGAQGTWLSQRDGGQDQPRIVPDGSGGAIVAWQDRGNNGSHVKVQKVDASGQPLWQADGVAVTQGDRFQEYPALAGDGQGGVIVVWEEFPTLDIYAQHLDGNGNPLWGADGLLLSSQAGVAGGLGPNVVADGSGGAIVAWHDFRNRTTGGILDRSDIYAVRLNAAGAQLWTPDGVPVLTGQVATPKAFVPGWGPDQLSMVADGAGGAIMVWHDARSGSNDEGWDIYAQRLDAGGNPVWPVNGVAVVAAPGNQIAPSLAADGEGGAYFAWVDFRPGHADIFMQQVTGAGAPLWGNGLWLQSGPEEQFYPHLVALARNRVAVTWDDQRNSVNGVNTGTMHDYLGRVVQLCFDRDGDGFNDQGGSCGPLPDARLSVTVSGAGAGTVESTPAGILCGTACSSQFPGDTSVTLVARAAPYSGFAGWGGACSGTGSCTVTMYGDQQVTAHFENRPAALNLTRLGAGTGTVTATPGTSCSGDCRQYFQSGSAVTLTAAPDPGSAFRGWGGACSGTVSCSVLLDGEVTVSATFASTAVASFAGGSTHSVAVIDGRIWTWGDNASGQLGDGSTTSRRYPMQLAAPAGVAGIGAGSASHVLALQEDGTLWGWGYNSYGQLGDGSTTTRPAPVQVALAAPVRAAGSGAMFSLALKPDGTVWGWGSNYYGQLGDGTTSGRTLPAQVQGLAGVVALATGSHHGLALKPDGTVWSWGSSAFGQLGDGSTSQRLSAAQVPGLTGVVAISTGGLHNLALKGDGTVWAWGYNYYGQLGDWSTTQRNAPVQVKGLTGVVAIAAGDSHSVALKGDGTVWTWGYNFYGQLGSGNTNNRSSAGQVSGISGVAKIAAGRSHTLAAKGDGTLWGWGHNSYGQLGDGSTTSRSTPVAVQFDTVLPTTTATPLGGSYPAAQVVTLSANETATIYYTLDGSQPSTSSAVYGAPLTISSTAVLKYFAKDSAGNSEAVQSQVYNIGAPSAPVADFSAASTSGNAPWIVNFSDLSTGGATSWLWSFGDGSTSTQQNPAHTYAAPGSYTVSLTASNALGSSTRTRSDYLSALDPGPASLQQAYNGASEGSRIKVRAGNLVENAIFDREVSIKIGGGYDFPYQQVTGATTIYGTIKIKRGTVDLGGLVLKW